jgi:hypothetical protein
VGGYDEEVFGFVSLFTLLSAVNSTVQSVRSKSDKTVALLCP